MTIAIENINLRKRQHDITYSWRGEENVHDSNILRRPEDQSVLQYSLFHFSHHSISFFLHFSP